MKQHAYLFEDSMRGFIAFVGVCVGILVSLLLCTSGFRPVLSPFIPSFADICGNILRG